MRRDANAAAVFEAVRKHYLDQLEAAILERRANGEDIGAELSLELENRAGLLRGLYCVDMYGPPPTPALANFDPALELTFDPFTFEIASMTVHVRALRWDDVAVSADADVAPEDVDRWFGRWFSPSDERPTDYELFEMIIHSASLEDGSIAVDFGSAPTTALWELLALVRESGARRVELGRSVELGEQR